MLPNSFKSDNLTKKDLNYKTVYDLKMNNEKSKKMVITKILKLNENNQYGCAMRKPLPTGGIKDSKDLSWETFNFLIETVSFKDTQLAICI